MTVLGVDIGTTRVKAIAFNEEGQRLASAQKEYPLIQPKPKYFELHPKQVILATEKVILQVSSSIEHDRIRAIASSSLGEAVLPVDSGGRPLYNSIVALDHRATIQVEWLEQRLSQKEFFDITGQSFHPIATIFKILWWKETHPHIFKKAHKFLCWNDMLALVLGIEPVISPSLAARTGLLDIRTGKWSPKLMELVGLTENRLASIVPTGKIVGRVGAKQAERLGLAKNCVFVSGGWDQACTALGSGAIEEGVIVNSMGSTDSLNATFDGIKTSSRMMRKGLTCTPHVLPNKFCTVAFSLSGGNLLNWYKECLDNEMAVWINGHEQEYYEYMVAGAFQNKNPVMVLAHFAGSGTPYMDPNALGAMLGLSLITKKNDIAMGILEGVALEMEINFRALKSVGIPIHTLYSSGGAAKNKDLLQLRSNVFNFPITALLVEESGCLGCAMLSFEALDSSVTIKDIVGKWVRKGITVEPQQEKVEYYNIKKELYSKVYPAIKKLNRNLRELWLFS